MSVEPNNNNTKAATAEVGETPFEFPVPMFHEDYKKAVQALEKKMAGTVKGEWLYTDERGTEMFWVLEVETRDGRQYAYISRAAEYWVVDQPHHFALYHEPDLIGDRRVYLCANEKDADSLRSIGLVATTIASGSDSPWKTGWNLLAGRDVVVLHNNDATSMHFAEGFASILNGLTPPATVRVLNFSGLTQTGGVGQFFELRSGLSADAIRAEIESMAPVRSMTCDAPASPTGLSWFPFTWCSSWQGTVTSRRRRASTCLCSPRIWQRPSRCRHRC